MSETNNIYSTTGTTVSNGTQPNAGKVFAFSATLVGVPVAFDLKPLVNLNRIDNVQGVFIDNSAGTSTLTCSTSIGQAIKVPAGFQACMPVYLSADKVITFNGNGTVPIVLLNFPTPAAVWDASGNGGSELVVIDGLLQVQDPALEALISAGGLNVNVIAGGSTLSQGYGPSDETVIARVRNSYNSGELTSGAQIVFSGDCYIDQFILDLSADATISSGGILGWQLKSVEAAGPEIVQSTQSVDVNGANIGFTFGATPTPGNKILMLATYYVAGGVFNYPSGWTKIATFESPGNFNGDLFIHTVQSGDSATYNGFSNFYHVNMQAMEIADASSIVVSQSGNATNSGNETQVSLPTAPTDDAIRLVMVWGGTGDGYPSAPVSTSSGMSTLLYARGDGTGAIGDGGPSMASPAYFNWGTGLTNGAGSFVVDIEGTGVNPVIAQGNVYVPGTATTTPGRINLCTLTDMKLTGPSSSSIEVSINSGTLATGGLFWTALGGATSVN